MTTVPDNRIRRGNGEAIRGEGGYVLYWMTAFRRLEWNYALQHAADLSRHLGKPLLLLEYLKHDYPHASSRFHHFILQGMAERRRALQETEVCYFPFVEARPGEGEGLLETLCEGAALVVTDDYPSFFLPGWTRSVGKRIGVRLDLVDSNGLLPLRAPEGKVFTAAYHFRRYLQRTLPEHLPEVPAPAPLSGSLPRGGGVLKDGGFERWPRADVTQGGVLEGYLSSLGLPTAPPPTRSEGTRKAAKGILDRFLKEGLHRYATDRNHPDLEVTSGLSPHLHFGLISSQEIFQAVAQNEGWTPLRLSSRTDGKREGWWGMGEGAEAFLDQLITWRELGFNMAAHSPDHTRWESLPDWARRTLDAHAGDERPYLYSFEEFRDADTHDPLWNAAQRELMQEGVIHNYLRMLWGKKILEWSASPREALETMIRLNDGLALDGRDPNSYSGIFWCLGRYDRGWPERPVFGKVRSMSSDATRRKVRLANYLDRFSS